MKELYKGLLEKAMLATTPEEAKEIFEQMLFVSVERGMALQHATVLAKKNLGYFAGYYSNEVRERVERLFDCEHPFFGKIAEKGPPTAEEAFKMGVEYGGQLRELEEKRGKEDPS